MHSSEVDSPDLPRKLRTSKFPGLQTGQMIGKQQQKKPRNQTKKTLRTGRSLEGSLHKGEGYSETWEKAWNKLVHLTFRNRKPTGRARHCQWIVPLCGQRRNCYEQGGEKLRNVWTQTRQRRQASTAEGKSHRLFLLFISSESYRWQRSGLVLGLQFTQRSPCAPARLHAAEINKDKKKRVFKHPDESSGSEGFSWVYFCLI